MAPEAQLAEIRAELEALKQQRVQPRRKFLKQDKEHGLQVLLEINNGCCLLTGNRIVSPDGLKMDGCEFHHIDGDRSKNHWSNMFPCHREGHNLITHARLSLDQHSRIAEFQLKLQQYKMQLLKGETVMVDSVGTMELFEEGNNVVPFKKTEVSYDYQIGASGELQEVECFVPEPLFDQAHQERMQPLIRLPKHKPQHTYRNTEEGKKRYYLTVTGDTFPGCTTILEATKSHSERQALASWRQRVGDEEAERVSNDATKRGTWLHSMVEAHLQCQPYPEMMEEYEGFWESIYPFLDRVSSPLLIESAVWHPSGYAGTLDCLAFLDGELALLDWKTSGKTKKEDFITGHRLQLGAYSQAVNWLYCEFGIEVSKAAIVIALPTREAQVFEYDAEELFSFQHGFNKKLEQYKELIGV